MADFEIRDPIHKRIPLNAFEKKVIGHPFLQRLRHISQLSFLQSYVYPGATHTRFSHVLGAMHVAGRLAGRVRSSLKDTTFQLRDSTWKELTQVLRLAGLLHDIGHGPFSHSSESIFPDLRTLPLNPSWWKNGIPDRQAKHEDYSVLLVQTMAEEGVLDETLAQDVASLIHGQIRPSDWFLDIERIVPTLQRMCKLLVSGEVDCDRMDYLLRDSYYCGVAYGQYDMDWLISSLGFAVKDGELILEIQENGVRAFEDMLLARYHMTDQVYYHKTKSGFAYYLKQAFKKGELDIKIPSDPNEYASMRDGLVIEHMFTAAEKGAYWSKQLVDRRPARHIMRFQHRNEQDQRQLANLIELCRREDIGFFVQDLKGALSGFDKPEGERQEMYVAKKTLRGVEHVPIEAYSGLLKRYNEKLLFTDLFIRREDYEHFQRAIA